MPSVQEQQRVHLGEFLTNKIYFKVRTDSSSGKSMATRIGVSKRAKHIELKHMFIQHLIHDGIPAIHKINSKHRPNDILTHEVCAKRSATMALVPSGHIPGRELRRYTAFTVSPQQLRRDSLGDFELYMWFVLKECSLISPAVPSDPLGAGSNFQVQTPKYRIVCTSWTAWKWAQCVCTPVCSRVQTLPTSLMTC